MIWIYVMMDDDEMMWDDDVWNYVVLFCVDIVMKWYELLWKWTVVNDEIMEVDDMTLGVFVSRIYAPVPGWIKEGALN